MKRRLFSILLALCMALAMLPTAAFAGESSYDSDITIKHSVWTFKSDKEVGYYIPTTNVNSVLTSRIPILTSR